MSKKNFREVEVEGVIYGYTISKEPHSNELKVWLNNQIIFRDHIHSHIHITPYMVKAKICVFKNSNNED